MQSFRGCPLAIGTMILWEVETDFPNWGLPFSLSMGSANSVPSPIQNPNENGLGSLFPVTSFKDGDHVQQCESEVRGLQPASHQVQTATWHLHCSTSGTLHPVPGRKATILPASVAALIMHTQSPSFLPSSRGSPTILLCRSNSLIYTMLQRDQASGDRWVGVETDLRGLGKA